MAAVLIVCGWVANTEAGEAGWWAYRPVDRPAVPQVRNLEWVQTPVDAFVLSRIESAGLQPTRPADTVALLRRAYYDLTGLPPSAAEIEKFVQDESSDAFARVVDSLLDTPHYGEKWGRHWLDVVRYAETNGYERDSFKPNVWRYRDYVIRAFNEDKPYDQFILEQLAGDELMEVTADSIIATGYHRLGIWDDEPTDPDQAYYDSLDDVVKTTSEVFLAMTMGCARCHDHKIDPLPQRDYYRMLGYFHNTYKNIVQHKYEKSAFTLNTQRTIANEEQRREHEQLQEKHAERLAKLEYQLEEIEEQIEQLFTNNDKDDLEVQPQLAEALFSKYAPQALSEQELTAYREAKRRLKRIKREGVPPLPQALCIKENGREAPPTHVHLRGNCHVLGDEVEPGVPALLGLPEVPIVPLDPEVTSSGRRLAFARWLVDPANPLTARVMVNRIWQHHFGRGIVSTPNDFGRAGSQPTHPQLLDWLATEFMQNGWSIKHLHRVIMLSNTYQLSNQTQPAEQKHDPVNDLFWRHNMRRLTAEEIRDSILLLNGTLNLEMYGPSVFPPMPAAVLATSSRPDAAWGSSSERDQVRRSIYAAAKRSLRLPILVSHDAADTDTSCPVRFATTVPTQALTMLNSEFINDQAAALSERLQRDAGESPQEQVSLALRLATCREPKEDRVQNHVAFLKELEHDFGQTREQALQAFCLMVLNLNEFVYLE